MRGSYILLPVDGSAHADQATACAVELARLAEGRILLLYCHRSFPKVIGEPYLQTVITRTLEDAQERLKPYCERLHQAGVQFEERIIEGIRNLIS